MRKLYIGGLIVVVALIAAIVYAEQITFSTYYPAPFGVYNQMVVRTLGVGDINNDGSINNFDAPDPNNPTEANDLWVAGNVGIGTTEPASGSKLDVNGKIYEYGSPLLPRGVIVMWSGSIANLPLGWVLCDGGIYTAADGNPITTPDLRDRFIYGTSAGEEPGITGGESGHQHEVGIYFASSAPNYGIALDPQWEYWGDSSINPPSGAERYFQYYAGAVRDKIMQTAPKLSLPAYYKLAFIMKL